MKLLCTLGFLVAAAAAIFLGNKIQGNATRQVSDRKTSSYKTTFFSILILILFFLQYSILTQQAFQYYIVLILIGASVAALLINEVIGSILGVSIKTIRHKNNLMYLAISFEQALNQPSKLLIMFLASLFLFGGWIGALTVFWMNPLGSAEAYVWIAIFIFISPQITSIINTLTLVSPLVSSEFVDDDVRNAVLASNFSSIIYSTIFFIFPFYLLSVEFSARFSWLPPFWFLLTIPMILFIFYGIIPFFIGTNKYKSQKQVFLEWKNNWLIEFREATNFSNPAKQSEELDALDEEIRLQVSESKMYSFLIDLEGTPENALENNNQKDVLLILKNNTKNIRKWHLQLWHIDQLTELREEIQSKAVLAKLKEFLNGQIESTKAELAQLNKSKNKAAGVITSVFIGVVGFLLKTFQNDIISFFARIK